MEGVLQAVAAPKPECIVFCFREVEGVDTQPADIVIDMFNTSCIYSIKMSQALLSLWEMLVVLHQLPKRNREIRSGSFFRRGL